VVDKNFILFLFGISALAVALVVVLKRLKSMSNRNMEVQDTIPQNVGSGKTFVEREVGIGKTDI